VADFFFTCWCSEIPSGNHIRHKPRCTKLSVGGALEWLCRKWKAYPRVVFCKSRLVWVLFYTGCLKKLYNFESIYKFIQRTCTVF
jgi:hypothetical protein